MASDSLTHPAQATIEAYRALFGDDPSHLSQAPGRVNVMGDHVDYNDGFVLPAAIGFHVCIAFTPRSDTKVRLHSIFYNQTLEFDLRTLARDPDHLWVNYAAGLGWSLAQAGYALRGFDGVMAGNVPIASGLSSSAALEIAAAQCFQTAGQLDIPRKEMAVLAQRAENDFVGLNCGIMDQFISVLGTAGHCLLIDCRSLEYELTSIPEGVSLVIGNTQASRSLAGSAYNQRRAECDEGLALLRQAEPAIQSWRDVSLELVMRTRARMSETIHQRCRHVVTEIQRTRDTAAWFAEGEVERVGDAMNESHASLRDDYAVGSPALDAMVDIMQNHDGCLGARQTGAGFGGCAVALVKSGAEQALTETIRTQYGPRTSLSPEVYVSEASDGAWVRTL